MPETLLSISEVLLFGRKVEDLEVKVPKSAYDTSVNLVSKKELPALAGHISVDRTKVSEGEKVLVTGQSNDGDNGIYTVGDKNANWAGPTRVAVGNRVYIEEGYRFEGTVWVQTNSDAGAKQTFQKEKTARKSGMGWNSLLDDQMEDGNFARIYGFSWEGTYYELPNPTLFMVHGDGESATRGLPAGGGARAPLEPSTSGVAAADYQMADDIRVWTYDKADFTVRMDVSNGMFEQVLLDMFFSGGDMAIAGAKVSGAKVSGAKVSGAKVSGAKVSGAKVSGAKLSGD